MVERKEHRGFLKATNGQTTPFRLEINARARRISVRIDSKHHEAVIVSPNKRSVNAALNFAEDRVDWIASKLSELPRRNALNIGDTALYRGDLYVIEPALSGRSVRIDVTDGERRILVPGKPDTAGQRVVGFLRASARSDFSERVAIHAQTLNVRPASISIKDTRTRWGSCSSRGNLNFSWRLICAPSFVLDYVAAHECAHLIEMNHSKAFWNLVDKCIADVPRARRWLNDNGQALHAIG